MGGSVFSQGAWARNAALYETIRTMPFNAELAAGSLSRERFRHYILQDAHYLLGFGRVVGRDAVGEESAEDEHGGGTDCERDLVGAAAGRHLVACCAGSRRSGIIRLWR